MRNKMANTETIKQEIKSLIDKYDKVVEEGRFNKYNEEMTKKDFILPLFRALGWNTEDSSEVTAEEKISKKRVDYSFRINGIPKFFLEAKALKADLDNTQFIDQAINYAWHKGCTWAVLTDFESVKIFNAEWKTANPLQSHLKTIPCHEYLDRFDELWLLSKEGFEQGLLDREAEKWGKKTKKSPVDKQLLSDFTRFREMLSQSISLLNGNRKLTGEELDESVQRILDRLIFIRNCEDRGLEGKTLISIYREWESSSRGHLIKNLRINFAYFDREYNSKIFSKHLCDELEVDNEVLHEIIEGLYYTQDKSVSYDFSAIEADVLGNIYEQYLGHILRKRVKGTKLTENHAHRKEQGIYYTPTYIVDYIVKNTLGELLKDKKVNVDKIRILDPACGSGSFLIKTFDLINKHHKKHDRQYSQTQLDLETGIPYTTKVKILQNNIHGVDLDRQAVEIAQLNLLLKIAEKGHRLPLLQENLKFGNSLIDNPAVAGKKAFDWHKEFGRIMDEGGFDIVIGNPPYVDSENMVKNMPKEREYIANHFSTCKGNWDLYIPFYELAFKCLKTGGIAAFITPNKWLSIGYGYELRKMLDKHIFQICDCSLIKVFKDAGNSPVIVFLKKGVQVQKIRTEYFDENRTIKKGGVVSSKLVGVENFGVLLSKELTLLTKIRSIKTNVCDFCNVENPFTVSEAYIVKNYISDQGIKKQNLKFINTGTIDRYRSLWGVKVTSYIKNKFLTPYVNTESFRISMPKRFTQSTSRKIIISGIRHFECYLDNEGVFVAGKSTIIIRESEVGLKLEPITAILNSKLIDFYIKQSYGTQGIDGGINFSSKMIKNLPMPQINQEKQKVLTKLVNKMLSLSNRLNELDEKKTDERTRIEDEIREIDLEIDGLVYKLYDITDQEKKIIEESLK